MHFATGGDIAAAVRLLRFTASSSREVGLLHDSDNALYWPENSVILIVVLHAWPNHGHVELRLDLVGSHG